MRVCAHTFIAFGSMHPLFVIPLNVSIVAWMFNLDNLLRQSVWAFATLATLSAVSIHVPATDTCLKLGWGNGRAPYGAELPPGIHLALPWSAAACFPRAGSHLVHRGPSLPEGAGPVRCRAGGGQTGSAVQLFPVIDVRYRVPYAAAAVTLAMEHRSGSALDDAVVALIDTAAMKMCENKSEIDLLTTDPLPHLHFALQNVADQVLPGVSIESVLFRFGTIRPEDLDSIEHYNKAEYQNQSEQYLARSAAVNAGLAQAPRVWAPGAPLE